MILIATILIVIVVFAATRFGVKSRSKNVRALSYVGIFAAVALLIYLMTLYLTEKLADNLPIL